MYIHVNHISGYVRPFLAIYMKTDLLESNKGKCHRVYLHHFSLVFLALLVSPKSNPPVFDHEKLSSDSRGVAGLMNEAEEDGQVERERERALVTLNPSPARCFIFQGIPDFDSFFSMVILTWSPPIPTARWWALWVMRWLTLWTTSEKKVPMPCNWWLWDMINLSCWGSSLVAFSSIVGFHCPLLSGL